MTNEALVAVPLFIFMGIMLEKTKIAGELLQSIGELFGSIKGGLGIGVVLVGMMLAASTGIVGATVVTMGTLSLPAMIKAGYDQKIATGTICAAGTLGQIIPPSIVLILLASILVWIQFSPSDVTLPLQFFISIALICFRVSTTKSISYLPSVITVIGNSP